MLRVRARVAREKRLEEKEADKRDIDLIRRAMDLTNNSEWPALQTNNQQHSAIAMIVTLAMLDEAATPGIFNNKLEQACKDNGLPEIKYKIEPETAKQFQRAMAGAAHGAGSVRLASFGATSTPSNDQAKNIKRNMTHHVHKNLKI